MLKEAKYEDIISGQGMAGIFGIPGLKISVHLYLVDGLLIDTGPASLLKCTSEFVKKHSVSQVALTHIHEDHAGMAPWIKENFQVPVYLHEESIAEAAVGTKLPFYRRIAWGNRKPFRAEVIPDVLKTEKYTFDIIDSPGHHPFHCVLHEKNQGWLFSGDLYVRQKQHVSYLDENTADVISTLQNILKLDFDTLFCGHAGIQKDGKTKLRIKLDHFESIQERVLELYQAGYSVKEISRMLYPKKDLWTIISRGEWSSYNLIRTAIRNVLS